MSFRKQRKLKIGAVELCDLPDLGIEKLHVRVDTGAATSSLHVDNIEEFRKGKKRFVSFDLHPDIHHVEDVVRTTAEADGKKRVKSSELDPTPDAAPELADAQLGLVSGSYNLEISTLVVDPEFEYMLTDADLDEDEELPQSFDEEEE